MFLQNIKIVITRASTFRSPHGEIQYSMDAVEKKHGNFVKHDREKKAVTNLAVPVIPSFYRGDEQR